MEYEFIEFKVGQRWKTRMGRTFIIKEIREEEYALVCISMDTGRKHFFDEDGYEVPGYPTDGDLVEHIS
ncbi:hypothetical protein GJV85_06455 [Sulfurimonas aquatica]|uniref:Uncharacterized protein n=1 Tax=Sulfurimonas aquatica TaxID=2672570 RepID=A0A975B0B0_9BACT|nr:hypothetical protein [Sulfurimonas aquatica]QSZ41763.1 hypothetical protein GJV85_06455 [Sulfurimonas aquatica]